MAGLGEQIEIANPEQPHCPAVLVLDVSGSMIADRKMEQLNDGLRSFKEDVSKDSLAAKRVDVAVVSFGGSVEVAQDFCSIEEFGPPVLEASGQTPMGEALLKAISMVEARKAAYRSKGMDYYRPWIFLITDGEPTDMEPGNELWLRVIQAIRDGVAQSKFVFFPVGVDPANMSLLAQISPPEIQSLKLRRGMWPELFQWLSKSMQRVSQAKVGDSVGLAPPGWASYSSG